MSKKAASVSQKRTVARRARYCCEYCKSQQDFSPTRFSVDHIIPRAVGGTTHLDNLAFSCQGCNGHKHIATSAIDPDTGGEVPLYHPRQERWEDHFEWSEDFTRVVGLTAIGRATIEKLQLTRPELMRLRYALYLVGKHPPQ
jgi:hypothetical protein